MGAWEVKPISLTTFIDFVSKSGTPKMTVVRDDTRRGAYDPKTDYWKRIRDAIIAVHTKGRPIETLLRAAENASSAKKRNYQEAARTYKRWLGKRKVNWFQPPSGKWRSNGISVNVNPELGLVINGEKHVVKLYFKEERLPKNRVELALQVMHSTLDKKARGSAKMCILDIRRGKLHRTSRSRDDLAIQLDGEAAYWAAVYPHV